MAWRENKRRLSVPKSLRVERWRTRYRGREPDTGSRRGCVTTAVLRSSPGSGAFPAASWGYDHMNSDPKRGPRDGLGKPLDPRELDIKSRNINKLPANARDQELGTRQGSFDLRVEKHAEVNGIGMGVLADGTAFLTGRGLARLVGIENLHIRTISQEWNEDPPKPRIVGIKGILARRGLSAPSAHIETAYGGTPVHAFPDAICLAILEYYAFDAAKPRAEARDNYRILAGKALRDLSMAKSDTIRQGAMRSLCGNGTNASSLTVRALPRGILASSMKRTWSSMN